MSFIEMGCNEQFLMEILIRFKATIQLLDMSYKEIFCKIAEHTKEKIQC